MRIFCLGGCQSGTFILALFLFSLSGLTGGMHSLANFSTIGSDSLSAAGATAKLSFLVSRTFEVLLGTTTGRGITTWEGGGDGISSSSRCLISVDTLFAFAGTAGDRVAREGVSGTSGWFNFALINSKESSISSFVA